LLLEGIKFAVFSNQNDRLLWDADLGGANDRTSTESVDVSIRRQSLLSHEQAFC